MNELNTLRVQGHQASCQQALISTTESEKHTQNLWLMSVVKADVDNHISHLDASDSKGFRKTHQCVCLHMLTLANG